MTKGFTWQGLQNLRQKQSSGIFLNDCFQFMTTESLRFVGKYCYSEHIITTKGISVFFHLQFLFLNEKTRPSLIFWKVDPNAPFTLFDEKNLQVIKGQKPKGEERTGFLYPQFYFLWLGAINHYGLVPSFSTKWAP